MFRRRKKGQSTLEYVLVLTALVALFVYFAGPGGTLRTAIGDIFTNARELVEKAADQD